MVIMNNSFAEIAEVIKQANNILIFTHHNMDGDAMGASNALGLAIQKLGKNVNVLYDESKTTIKAKNEAAQIENDDSFDDEEVDFSKFANSEVDFNLGD